MIFHSRDKSLRSNEALFVAVLKVAENEGDVEFLTNSGMRKLGQILGIGEETCERISEKYKSKYRLNYS